MSAARVIVGDCRDVLRTLEAASIDAIVSDPPSGTGFMGASWDGHKGGREQWVAWLAGIMVEARRVLKPGGMAFVWALPRTSHWTATALEDAGFEIRDVVTHHYAQGFPKSLNVGKAIDKAANAERAVVGWRDTRGDYDGHRRGSRRTNASWRSMEGRSDISDVTAKPMTAPATDDAKRWDGWGTALKPASEHWILARAPLSEPTVAANVLRHGVGALNIAACRVGTARAVPASLSDAPNSVYGMGWSQSSAKLDPNVRRWPPNLLLSHSADCAETCAPDCPVAELDRQSGTLTSGGYPPAGGQRSHVATYGKPNQRGEPAFGPSVGGASRFFPTFHYFPKPDRAERDAMWGDVPQRFRATMGDGIGAREHNPDEPTAWARNHHPTVKSVDLMRWLCKLVTPPGGTVLDMFMGSGSTGVGCLYEGFGFIGIEQDPGYAEIARARLAHASGPLFSEEDL